MFVATNLSSWATDQPHLFARDVQINNTSYRRLDLEYYAWLRSRMNLARLATMAGQLTSDDFDVLRGRFNAMHEWALQHLGEQTLLEAVHHLDSRRYEPPVAERQEPIRAALPVDSTAAEATSLVDAILERALALGWTRERLYGTGVAARTVPGASWSLVDCLRPGSSIGELTTHSIEIILANNVRQRFYNPDVEQPWIQRIHPRPHS